MPSAVLVSASVLPTAAASRVMVSVPATRAVAPTPARVPQIVNHGQRCALFLVRIAKTHLQSIGDTEGSALFPLECIMLPSYPELSNAQIYYITKSLLDYLDTTKMEIPFQ